MQSLHLNKKNRSIFKTFVFPGQNVVKREAEDVAAPRQSHCPPLPLPTHWLQGYREVITGS